MPFAGIQTNSLGDLPSDRGRWLIHGPQGAGKSTLASTIAETGRTLFIDLTGERGTRSFQGAPYASNIEVARPSSIQQLDDVYWALAKGDHQYEAVVIDSLTALQKMTHRFLLGHSETAVREITKGSAPADMRTWGQSLDVMTDVATFWFGLADAERSRPMHVAMTAQTKIGTDEDGNQTTRVPDVQKGALSIVMATCDYALYCDYETEYDDEGEPFQRHIVRFGSSSEYRIKARVPMNLRGKIPSILGRKRPLTLTDLSRNLGISGVPTPAAK